MVQQPKRFKKEIAVSLRKSGSSLSEIETAISISKSTLSFWLKGVKLTSVQREKLKEKQKKILKKNSEKRVLKTFQKIEEVKNISAEDIKEISKREFWLMGIMLYWRERSMSEKESDLKNGVRFTNSDPRLIKLFLKWLKEIGRIKDEEIGLDIFISKDKKNETDKIIDYWSKITGFSNEIFSHIYFQKNKKVKTRKRNSKKGDLGFLRVRVKASSMLARQIAGWTRGIENNLKLINIIKP